MFFTFFFVNLAIFTKVSLFYCKLGFLVFFAVFYSFCFKFYHVFFFILKFFNTIFFKKISIEIIIKFPNFKAISPKIENLQKNVTLKMKIYKNKNVAP